MENRLRNMRAGLSRHMITMNSATDSRTGHLKLLLSLTLSFTLTVSLGSRQRIPKNLVLVYRIFIKY